MLYDFDIYTLWLLEQEHRYNLSKHLERYAQIQQIKAKQPPRQLWPTVGAYVQALIRTVRAFQRRCTSSRPVHQDTPIAVHHSVRQEVARHDANRARHTEPNVAASP